MEVNDVHNSFEWNHAFHIYRSIRVIGPSDCWWRKHVANLLGFYSFLFLPIGLKKGKLRQYHGCSPILQHLLRNKLQAAQANERYINCSRWFLFVSTSCKIGGATMILQTSIITEAGIFVDRKPSSCYVVAAFASRRRFPSMNTWTNMNVWRGLRRQQLQRANDKKVYSLI